MVCSLSIIYFILSLVSLHEQSLTSLHAKSSPVPIKRRQSSNKSITSPFTSPVSVILWYKYIFSPLPHSFLLSLSSFLPSSLSLSLSSLAWIWFIWSETFLSFFWSSSLSCYWKQYVTLLPKNTLKCYYF